MAAADILSGDFVVRQRDKKVMTIKPCKDMWKNETMLKQAKSLYPEESFAVESLNYDKRTGKITSTGYEDFSYTPQKRMVKRRN